MRRFTFLALCLLWVYISPASSTDEFRSKIVNFDPHHVRWIREYYGCPGDGEITQADCKPHLGKMDWPEYRKARKAAAELYGLVIPDER
jgi:hypothetical protein